MLVLDIQKLKNAINHIKDAVAEQGNTSNLANNIASIKQAFESHWQENYIPLAEKILDKLNEGIPTPVLTVCGQGTREIRFTRYLAYYLDPSKSHGLGNRVLKSVLGTIAKEFNPDWAENCEIIPEKRLGNYPDGQGKEAGCFCDIGITGDSFAIIIEQKILSGESMGRTTGLSQLIQYAEVLKENQNYMGKQVIKVFLTPSGEVPVKAKAVGWIGMSYGEVIENCYEILKKAHLTATARENLRSFLVDLIIGPYEDTEELQELKSLALKLVTGDFIMKDVISFSSITNDNRMLINVILEGES